MAKFKAYAYFFGGIFLIIGTISNTIRELKENNSYDGFIFGGIFIFIGYIWIKEGLKKRKELKNNH
jgi:putative Mn2+ efflux pump MntP